MCMRMIYLTRLNEKLPCFSWANNIFVANHLFLHENMRISPKYLYLTHLKLNCIVSFVSDYLFYIWQYIALKQHLTTASRWKNNSLVALYLSLTLTPACFIKSHQSIFLFLNIDINFFDFFIHHNHSLSINL